MSPSGAILDAHFAIGDPIGDKVVSDVDMHSALAAGSPAIVFKLDGALVVLVTYDVLDIFLLGFQEVSVPDRLGQNAINSYQFGFRGTSCGRM